MLCTAKENCAIKYMYVCMYMKIITRLKIISLEIIKRKRKREIILRTINWNNVKLYALKVYINKRETFAYINIYTKK